MSCATCNGNHYVQYDDGTYMTCTACAGDAEPTGRDAALAEAKELISGHRHRTYGSAQDNFRRIATGWSEIFNQPVTLAQVALAMDWVKSARLIQTPDHHDSWVDKLGYSALGAEITDD